MNPRTRNGVSSSPPSSHDIRNFTNGNSPSISSCRESTTSPPPPTTTTTTRRNISQKVHLVTVIVCLVIICLNRYQKAIHAIDSSSFFQEDKSFHPPLFLISSGQKHQDQSKSEKVRHQRFNNNNNNNTNYYYTFNDDDYPPPREIFKDDNDKEKRKQQYRQELNQRQQQQQQQQNSITAQRLQSIQKFRNTAGISSSSTGQTTQSNPKQTNPRQFYDIVNGKKTLTYKRLYPRVLYFVHIHKSAGTLICNYAYKNRLSSEHMRNCNIQEDQHCCGNSDTLEAQIQFANTTYYDFVAIEREMYDSMAPDHYDYIACVRNSKSRYYSHWGHLRRLVPADLQARRRTGGYGTAAWIMNDTTAAYAALPSQSSSQQQQQQQQPQKKKNIADLPKILYDIATNSRSSSSSTLPRVDPLGSFEMWYKYQPDNWNTRIFCGPKCMSIPKYQISKELFHYVLQRLDKFRHFIFVENITSSINTMADYYGWTIKHNESHVKNQRYDHVEAKKQLSKQIWDYKMSVLDDAIYEFGQRKYNNISSEKLWSRFSNQHDIDKYFNEGSSNGCTNACCGECSLY